MIDISLEERPPSAEQETKIQTLAVAKLVIISNSNPELLKQMIFNLIVNLKLQNSTEHIQLESCSGRN